MADGRYGGMGREVTIRLGSTASDRCRFICCKEVSRFVNDSLCYSYVSLCGIDSSSLSEGSIIKIHVG